MNTRTRQFLAVGIVVSAALIAVAAAVALIAPLASSALDTLGRSLADRMLPAPVSAAIGVATGLAGIALGVRGIVGPTGATPPVLRIAAVVLAVIAFLLTPGSMIPVAGYTFAMVVIVGAVVLAALLVRRHLWWGLAVIAVLAGIVTWAVVRMQGALLAQELTASLVEKIPVLLLAAAHLVLLVALTAWAATGSEGSHGRFASWVLRNRIAITIAAACCALPYTIARASWLTPWPLLAPSGVDLADVPMVLLTGLGLGAAMLAGGVLTLGLILPWGRRFPGWMGGLGGRAVPVALAAVPAFVVAALFLAGGVDWIVSVLDGSLGDGSFELALELVLVFPFWLWGPLLALAAWGYVLHRRDASDQGQLTLPDTEKSSPVATRRS
ncbi:hypothetical protein [Microbacterium sp. KHB019]|uniref:hypothetical protein n=1 Tax=Microbacterium sp. KHB019 TaxID=3129770 RepID=UPI00307A8AA6